MKKDILFGFNGKTAVIVGFFIYLISRFIPSTDNLLFIALKAMVEFSGLWFFILGLFRWNKEAKAKKTKAEDVQL